MKKGFTLIETLIAVSIVSLSVAGPLLVADRASVAAQLSRDQVVAGELASEGIEYVRSMRDHEYLSAYAAGGAGVSTKAWQAFAADPAAPGSILPCEGGASCALDPSLPMGHGAGDSIVHCAGVCAPLYLHAGGLYTLSAAGAVSPTIFTRSIKATLISGNDMQITSTVTWKFHGTTETVALSDHLTPWE